MPSLPPVRVNVAQPATFVSSGDPVAMQGSPNGERLRAYPRTEEARMSVGPVEYMIVAFPGNQFKGEVIPALQELVDNGTINVIDLAFVIKDAEGNMAALEAGDLDSDVGAAFAKLGGANGGLLNQDDLEAAAEELEPNSSAALLVWEDVWATKLRDAILNAGGELLDLERLPGEVVQAAVDWANESA
jgi:uncharacterized membrane protein